MPKFEDVFYALGRNYFPRGNMHAVQIGQYSMDSVTGLAEAMWMNQKVYGIQKHVKAYIYGVLGDEKPDDVIEFRAMKENIVEDFKGQRLITLYIDFPKNMEKLTQTFEEWKNHVVPGGLLIFRDAYEDDELRDHPMAQLGKTCLHGIYRSDPNITVFLNKWGITNDK